MGVLMTEEKQEFYYHYGSLCKAKKMKRHSEEKDHMIQLRAVGSITAEYISSSSSSAEPGELDDASYETFSDDFKTAGVRYKSWHEK